MQWCRQFSIYDDGIGDMRSEMGRNRGRREVRFGPVLLRWVFLDGLKLNWPRERTCVVPCQKIAKCGIPTQQNQDAKPLETVF